MKLRQMKKICYIFVVLMYILFVWPLMFISIDKWNEVGRKIDNYFGFKSPHTKNFEKNNTKNEI